MSWRRPVSEVGADQRPAAPDRLCSVDWCIAERADGHTVCAVHRAHPKFKPEELDAKDGHFEAEPEWVEQDCKECDGDGTVDHECDCDKCTVSEDDCDACGGDGQRNTCSLCGFQSTWCESLKQHEAKCWQPAAKPQAVAS